MLHALSAVYPATFPSTSSTTDDADEEPVTSLACTWKQPRKRKASNHAVKCYRSGLGNLVKVNQSFKEKFSSSNSQLRYVMFS